MKFIIFVLLFSFYSAVSQTKDALSNYNTFITKKISEKRDGIDDSIRKVKVKERIIFDELEVKRRELEEKKREKIDIAKYGIKTYNKLKSGIYWIGITKEMAIIALGNPTNINQTVGAWGVHEQWVYNNNFYLYFENGKLTSYQN
jgi:hypothetical protein